ncbi:MAG: GGDEF domain-containing protein [Planctomycetota bacterium]|jgi:GGDEF domain-containing protein
MTVEKQTNKTNGSKLLFIGDIEQAFVDCNALKNYQVRENILDGIEAAGRSDFVAIGVVMSGISKLSAALEALNEVNPTAKVILLARMHEEPKAIKSVGSARNEKSLAYDYLIYPAKVGSFYEIAKLNGKQGDVSEVEASVVDEDIKERVRRLEELATTDELTGLKNRRYIWEFARQVIEHAKKENGRVTLLIFDIDDFKHYNDVYSHLAGDEILKQAATLIRRCCRPHDVVGRIGGDEFAVIFWDDPKKRKQGEPNQERRSPVSDHPKEAIFIANRFRRELGKAELSSLGTEGKGVLAISGGLASFPRDGSNIQQLFKQADKALLNAKDSGKNRIYLIGSPQGDIEEME